MKPGPGGHTDRHRLASPHQLSGPPRPLGRHGGAAEPRARGRLRRSRRRFCGRGRHGHSLLGALQAVGEGLRGEAPRCAPHGSGGACTEPLGVARARASLEKRKARKGRFAAYAARDRFVSLARDTPEGDFGSGGCPVRSMSGRSGLQRPTTRAKSLSPSRAVEDAAMAPRICRARFLTPNQTLPRAQPSGRPKIGNWHVGK